MKLNQKACTLLAGAVVAAAIVVGTQAAGAAPSHDSVAAVKAIPNIAYVFTTNERGGTGSEKYTLPSLPEGIYTASFTANFVPLGTPKAPRIFGCAILRETTVETQDTSTSTQEGLRDSFYVGVNGTAIVQVYGGAEDFEVSCGLPNSGIPWLYGTRRLQVSLTRLDGQKQGALTTSRSGLPASTVVR